MITINRRSFLKGMVATSALATSACYRVIEGDGTFDYELIIEETPIELIEGYQTNAFTFNHGYPSPVIRTRQGELLTVKVTNKLSQPTTIHWHGIRIVNEMDGVPYLTQLPIMPGESFTYSFVCPDAGTFWYHPHTNSLEQMSKGLVGCIIVEETESTGFDEDLILMLKDWHLEEDGSFAPFTSPRNAARMGTLGNHKTVNGKVKPVIEVPGGKALRLRFANVDNTRTYNLSLKDYPALVVAEDGNPLSEPYELDARPTGAGMRLDLSIVTPNILDEEVIIYDKKGKWYFELCRLKVASKADEVSTQVERLPGHVIPEPNLSEAQTMAFVFEWEGAVTPDNKDGKMPAFWTMNRIAWEGMMNGELPEPIAKLKLNQSYIFDLHNASPNKHPIHLHGYTFKVLESNQREITPYFTDTILLNKNEKVRIAFVADNPGGWMFHCHVIEHMKTGLMGYIEVS